MPTDSRSGCPASGLAAKHDTTCARKAEGLLGALAPFDAEHQIPTLTDAGYVEVCAAIRHPVKKPNGGGSLTADQQTYNKVLRGVRGVAERANALFKETFAALQRVSLCPWRIGAIAKAALVLLHLEHDRSLPSRHTV